MKRRRRRGRMRAASTMMPCRPICDVHVTRSRQQPCSPAARAKRMKKFPPDCRSDPGVDLPSPGKMKLYSLLNVTGEMVSVNDEQVNENNLLELS